MNKTHAFGIALMVFGYLIMVVMSMGIQVPPIFGFTSIGAFFLGLILELVGHTNKS